MKKLMVKKCLLVIIMLAGAMIIFPRDVKAAECSASTICGSSCTYGGVTYNTVIIGSQCWFKENLNVGTMIGNLEIPDNTAPSPNDPSTIQKWCYDDSLSNCATEGGLYTWAEANGLANSCNTTHCSVSSPSQGICPAGWHIPSDAEFFTLENNLTTPGQTCDATRSGFDCSDAGLRLILGGTSGFDAISAGNHETNGNLSFFDKRESSIHFWSSSELVPHPDGNFAWHRTLMAGEGQSTIYRGSYIKEMGYSIRCLADTANIEMDQDGDGVYDDSDNCLEVANPDQADNDSDGIGDVCDLDDDNDSIVDEDDCVPTNSEIKVLAGTKACQLWKNGVPGKGILNAPGLQKPFNGKSQTSKK